MDDTDVLVIGAGLAGLSAALLLHEAGKTVRVLEAQAQPGGRIRSVFGDEDGAYAADLGPTWIWTAYQPIARNWLEKLGLEVFRQYEDGMGIVDQGEESQPVTYRMPGQPGSMRVVGGSQAIVDGLVGALPQDALRTSCPVAKIQMTRDGAEITAGRDALQTFHTRQLVVAIPLRLATRLVTWDPELPNGLRQTLGAIPTWMAPHAKAVVLYEHPFWREAGLSGRIVSRSGPLVEAHDHCGQDGAPAALFGFVGWSPTVRAERGMDALEAAIEHQLIRCFGASSPQPLAIHIQDWATCPFVASLEDLVGPMDHPSVGSETLREPHFDDRVWFCISEAANQSPGLIEGAFAAARHSVASMTRNA